MADVRAYRKSFDMERAILDALQQPRSARELWIGLKVQWGGSKTARRIFDGLVAKGAVTRYGVRNTFESGPEPLFVVSKTCR